MNFNIKNIFLISGSLRKDSFNTKVLRNIEKEIIVQGLTTTFVDLNDFPIPFYNEDIELQAIPINVLKLKDILQSSSGLIVSSPEYNGEISAVLKNMFDWLSRKSVNGIPKKNFLDLKTIVVGVSIGKNGAKRSLERLHVLLGNLGVNKDILSYSLAKASNDIFDNRGNLLIDEEIIIIKDLIANYLSSADFLNDKLENLNKKVIQN